MMLANPEALLHAQHELEMPGVQCLGTYGVLGRYDFVTIVEAPDNDAVAQFSLELGARAGVHIETLPAVPLGHFRRRDEPGVKDEPRSATLDA